MYYFWESGIKKTNCENLIKTYDPLATINSATVSEDGNQESNPNIRKQKVCWVESDEVIVRALWSYILEANNIFFHYDISKFEQCQFTKSDNSGFYSWHRDRGEDNRKLSAILHLSDSTEYEGGELQFFKGDKDPEELPIKNRGGVIVFDASDWHRLTPVLKGTRYSLVMWASGSNFR